MEGGESGELKPLVATQNPISTQIELISSKPLLQQTIEQLNLKNDRGESLEAADLQTAITSKIIGGADVLQINYKNRDPKQAANVVNMLMKTVFRK